MHIKTRNQALRRATSLINRFIAKHKDKTKLQCLYELRKHKKYKHCKMFKFAIDCDIRNLKEYGI